MITEKTAPIFQFVLQPSVDDKPHNTSFQRKRKLGPHGPLLGLGIAELCYPSPPMSVPSSPTSTTAELHQTITSGEAVPISQSLIAPVLPRASASGSASPFIRQSVQPTAISPAPTSDASTGTFASVPQIASEQSSNAPPAFAFFGTFPARTSRRSGRKTNTNVPSACVNCKRAHLSCDVQRPCSRCIAAGKQDTCYDVQHKKRGRPRLSGDAIFQVSEQIPSAPSSQPVSPSTTIASTSSRPIATPRPRRASSLRSQASEGYPSQPFALPSTTALQPPQAYARPPSASLAAADIPTAFLDLDLTIVRANRPFEHIVAHSRPLAGAFLSDIISTADGKSLDAIGAQLTAERASHEQSTLPPPYPSGPNNLDAVSEAEIEHLAAGFEDRTYTWSRKDSPTDQHVETFPARVRLARFSSTYFIAITLPTFRPVIPTPPQQHQAFAPVPPQPYPSVLPSQPRPRRDSYQTFATSHPSSRLSLLAQHPLTSWTSMQQPTPPRLPPLEPAPDIVPFGRRASQADVLTPLDSGSVQLPPIGASPSLPGGFGGPSSGSPGRPPAQQVLQASTAARRLSESEDDEGDQRTRKKRKIMGIDNVLQ